MSYLIPTVIETSPRGDRTTDIYSRLLSERIVFIGSPIDDGVANVVIAQLLHLAADNPASDISIYINSPGGSFTAMLAIYDTIQFVAPDVATICVGQAASSAAILLAAGSPGKRAVLEHSRVVFHQPHSETGRASMSDLALEADELERVRCEAEAILARHVGRTAAQVRADTERILVLAGHAAVAYGVADHVAVAASGGAQLDARPTALHPGPGAEPIGGPFEHISDVDTQGPRDGDENVG